MFFRFMKIRVFLLILLSGLLIFMSSAFSRPFSTVDSADILSPGFIDYLENLPWAHVNYIQCIKPNQLYGSSFYNKMSRHSWSLQRKKQKAKIRADFYGIGLKEHELNATVGAYSMDFGYLNYVEKKDENFVSAFKKAYASYGVRSDTVGEHRYWYTEKNPSAANFSGQNPAFTFTEHGILEGGKQDIELYLKKKEASPRYEKRKNEFQALLPVVDLESDEYFIEFGDKQASKINFLESLAVTEFDKSIYEAADSVEVFAFQRNWEKGLKTTEYFIFYQRKLAERGFEYVQKHRKKLVAYKLKRVYSDFFNRNRIQKKKEKSKKLQNNLEAAIDGTVLTISFYIPAKYLR